MANKFVLGDVWQEITNESVSVDETAERADRLPSDAIDFSNVFLSRVVALTTTGQKIYLPVVARFVDCYLAGAGTDYALISLGESVDAAGLIIGNGQSIKIPLQRLRSIAVMMAAGTGTLYIVANNEQFRIWG